MARDRFFWKAIPSDAFRADGFEVIDQFLSPEECDRLVSVADKHRKERSYVISGNAYFVNRRDMKTSRYQLYDLKTSQIYNIQDLDPGVAQLFQSGRVEKEFESRLGQKLSIASCTIQIDEAATENRQPYHVDSYTPPSYKAFIYLNDVDKVEHGPFTIIPGSHTHFWRKLLARALNLVMGKQYAQMELVYGDSGAKCFLAKKGTCLFATVSAVHKGWHYHPERTRYVLVIYMQPIEAAGRPYTSGLEFARSTATHS